MPMGILYVMPFEVREEKHTPETDLTRHRQVFEEGDKFERSFLRLDRCFLIAFWNDLRLPLIGFLRPSRRRMQVVLKQLPHHWIQSTKSGMMGKTTEDEVR